MTKQDWMRPVSFAMDTKSLADLDRLARAVDRSRSRIVRELIRREAARLECTAQAEGEVAR